MVRDYLVGLVALLTACILSLLLSGGIVRRVTRSVTDMNSALASFSMDGSDDNVKTPGNTPSEFRPIFRQMRKRSSALKRAHSRLQHSIRAGLKLQSELTQAVSAKESEIARRTAELEEANRKLSGLNKIDALTGIANRREFDAFAGRVWKVGVREGTSVAVIMMDIDYFKGYNDSLGHVAGDACLCRVAEALVSSALRPLDLVARYGGEEFVAVLANASEEEALIVAERMRLAIAELKIPHPGSPFDVVTISIGVASSMPLKVTGYADILKAADDALYQAKKSGRNSVVYQQEQQFLKFNDQAGPGGSEGSIRGLESTPSPQKNVANPG